MLQTRLMQTSDTRQAARYVTNRVRGDLRAIHEKFNMSSLREIQNLADDVELGLSYDCLSRLSLFLYPSGWSAPHTAYIYNRVAPGSFEPSAHSGRIVRCNLLVNGRLEFEVGLRDPEMWSDLRERLKINWVSCLGTSTTGMSLAADGGYASGELAFSRNYLRREGY